MSVIVTELRSVMSQFEGSEQILSSRLCKGSGGGWRRLGV